VVHAETSTGVLQDVPPIKAVADEVGALFLLDCVTSLAGHDVALDKWGVDLEIGDGLGPMKGNTWRIGLMGAGATRRNVELCLAGLTAALRDQGHTAAADPLAAAARSYA